MGILTLATQVLETVAASATLATVLLDLWHQRKSGSTGNSQTDGGHHHTAESELDGSYLLPQRRVPPRRRQSPER